MKKLERCEMKNLRGGLNDGGGFGCMEASSCSLVIQTSNGNSTWYGTCGLMDGRCKCITDAGNYQTANGTYACESHGY